jgi:hypothetical protein
MLIGYGSGSTRLAGNSSLVRGCTANTVRKVLLWRDGMEDCRYHFRDKIVRLFLYPHLVATS